MFFKKKIILVLLLLNVSSISYANIIVGTVIEEAKEAADELVNTAFDRMDSTLLQAAVDARATINQTAESLKDVVGYSITQLDGQQRRLLSDLQSFRRSVSRDVQDALNELKEEKNFAISDLRLIFFNTPGAIRIISGYILEGAQYIDFKLYGSALSKVKIKNSRLNNRSTMFFITNQTDTSMTIRVPVSKSVSSMALAQKRGKAGEIKMEFEFIETSWIFFTKRRNFSSTGYIIPKQIGTAFAVYSGTAKEKEYKKGHHKCVIKSTRRKITYKGRIRGRVSGKCLIEPPVGWLVEISSAKFKLNKNSHCSSAQSTATWASRGNKKLQINYHIVSHKGRNSGTCKSSITVNYRVWKFNEFQKTIKTPIQKITTHSDNKFYLTPKTLRNHTGIRLAHIEVKSPFFENGVRIIRSGQIKSGLSTIYDSTGYIAYLRFTGFR